MSHRKTIERWCAEDPDNRKLTDTYNQVLVGRTYTVFVLSLYGERALVNTDETFAAISVVQRLNEMRNICWERRSFRSGRGL